MIPVLAVGLDVYLKRELGDCFESRILGLHILQLLGENIKPRQELVFFISGSDIAAVIDPDSKLAGM